jgi:N-acetyl-alpha-D-muramate 1-phosphate uridylyltransferase
VQVLVLAGGLATRMRPLTEKVPKVLLPVCGRPFVELLLERLVTCGATRVTFCVAYLGDLVRAYVGDGQRFGVHVDYSDEGDTLLGTGGALRRALPLLDETFLVTYGDSYLPFDYSEPLRVLDAHGDCDGVMSVYCNFGKFDASNVRTDGQWVLAYEKGAQGSNFDYIDYGALALRKRVVMSLPIGPSSLDSLQSQLARDRRMRAVVAEERFFEIGSPGGLLDLERSLQ